MKAIILTYAPVSATEKELLKTTNIFKLALNQHAEELNPHKRIISDYVLPKIIEKFPQDVVSIREKLRCDSPRVEYPDIEFKGSTIVAALEYLICKGFDEILIVGDNMVNTSEFQTMVKNDIENLVSKSSIYQYTNGNFNLPVMKIEDFVK